LPAVRKRKKKQGMAIGAAHVWEKKWKKKAGRSKIGVKKKGKQ